MNSLLSFAFALFLLAASTAFAGDEFALMNSEMLGPIKLGLSKKEVFSHMKSKPKFGRIEELGADGSFHQQVDFPSEGVSITLVSDTKVSPQTIDSITIHAPCGFNSKAGIHIGSTISEVTNAYRGHFNKEDSQPGQSFVAGSIYGGIIFSFKAGKVSQIFLGASAE